MLDEGRLHLISLPGAVDRQRQVLEWCGPYGLSRQIFRRGVDRQTLRQSPGLRSAARGNPTTLERYGRARLQSAEYGCLMSHRAIYAEMRDRRIPWALILEDDVRPFEQDWPGMVHRLGEQISHSALNHQPWVCHLGLSQQVLRRLALRPVHWRTRPPSGSGNGSTTGLPRIGRLDPSIGRIWTTHAYLMSLAAVTSILSSETAMTYVADDWDIRLQRGWIQPMLATLSPLFLPLAGIQSQIPQRTHFQPLAKEGHAEGRPGMSDRVVGLRSAAYRINRKIRTLVYRAGLGSVTY
jgi:hypothetical protein